MNRLAFLVALSLFTSAAVPAAPAQQNLYQASESGDVAALRKALKGGADIDKQDADGWTALIFAATEGHEQAVRLLLSAGANPNLAGKKGETALIGAVMSGKAPLVKALLDVGADTQSQLVNGKTALDLARQKGDATLISLLQADSTDSSSSRAESIPRSPAATTGNSVSIEEIKRVIPDWALPSVTDKTLEYMQYIAQTSPVSKAREVEEESSYYDEKTTPSGAKISQVNSIIKPVFPGIESSETAQEGKDYSSKSSGLSFLSGAFSKSIFTMDGPYGHEDDSQSVTNIQSYSGKLFPLKVGNTFNVSVKEKAIHENLNNHQRFEINMERNYTYTVIGEIDGSRLTGFPVPISGKVYKVVIATQSKVLDGKQTPDPQKNIITVLWFSDALGSFITMGDEQANATQKWSARTTKFKFLD